MEYEVWWPLHIRFAKGEKLSSSESAVLQAAYAAADQAEIDELSQGRSEDLINLRKLRDEVRSLQAKIAIIQKQRRRTSSRIRRLAIGLDPETREAIGLSSAR